MLKSTIYLSVFLLFFSCENKQPETPTLQSAFKDDFAIGAALGAKFYDNSNPKAAGLIKNQFAVYTPENVMKSQKIHPEWHRYDFEKADQLIALAEQNNAKVVGHTLIWHSQLSPFIGDNTSSDSLRMFMEQHIATVAGRYEGKIMAWDVVNEALNDDGSLRNSVFLQKLGDEYLIEAFRLAEKATPSSELYYNDYDIEYPQKRAGAIELIKRIQKAGVKIDGVGIQGHWNISTLPLEEIEESIIAYHELGIKVMITELDLSVIPSPWDLEGAEVEQNYPGSPFMNPYPNGLPTEVSQKLADSYKTLFELFLKHKEKISRVTFWGVHDGSSWLNNWPIKGRTNYLLLFDRNFEPKKAYNAVVELKQSE